MNLRLAIGAAAATILLIAALGFYWKGRVEEARAQRSATEATQAATVAARLELQGARDNAARVDLVVRQRDLAAATVSNLMPSALKSEDAHAPLAAARADRLQRADRELCQLAPALDGCVTPD